MNALPNPTRSPVHPRAGDGRTYLRILSAALPLAALALVLAVASIPLATAGCNGAAEKAEDSVLMPATKSAWDSAHHDVLLGIDEAEASGELTPAEADDMRGRVDQVTQGMQSNDREAIAAARWTDGLLAMGLRGVDARAARGEIGPGVASSLRERFAQVTKAIDELTD